MTRQISFVKKAKLKIIAISTQHPERINGALALALVQEFREYFKAKYDQDVKNNKVRKTCHLSSTQTALSSLKKIMQDEGITNTQFCKQLHLTRDEGRQIKITKVARLREQSIDIPTINAEPIIEDCRALLQHPNKFLRLIACACLSGRRTAELLYTMSFHPPKLDHETHARFWTEITGICKQRGDDADPLVAREIPLLIEREKLVACLKKLRLELPCDSVQQVNSKYGKQIQRTMHKFVPMIKNIHQFRKFYVFTCFEYFNEHHCSIARLAADYLAHKTMSETVLTYLNFRVIVNKSLIFK
jgi:hypothetical protein